MNAPRTDKGARWEELASRWVKHTTDIKPAVTARDAVAQGAALLMIKEASPKGTWRNEVNKRGLSASTASRLMACARRFHGAGEAFFDAVGSASKLAELLPLDERMVSALEQGEALHGLTLDGIRTMAHVELRTAARAATGAGADSAQAPASAPPRAAPLTVEEERMLRLFRRLTGQGRSALLSVAEALSQH